MGEAKRNRELRSQVASEIAKVDFDGIARAIRSLAQAASGKIGSDCYVHAALAKELIREAFGIDRAKVVVGFAAWRVGKGDGDVVAHVPQGSEIVLKEAGKAMYHAWVELDGIIFDTTTYQLKQKAMALDAMDGGSTTVDWCPDYLVAKPNEICSYMRVANDCPGLFYYDRVQKLEAVVSKGFELDQADVDVAMLCLKNPEMGVLGPMNFPVTPKGMR